MDHPIRPSKSPSKHILCGNYIASLYYSFIHHIDPLSSGLGFLYSSIFLKVEITANSMIYVTVESLWRNSFEIL